MKILLFCHLGQIREYAGYVQALAKVKPVESLFLTMGQEEFEFGKKVDTFDEVKDILPDQAELDAAGSGLDAAQSLKDLEERIGYRFVHTDILMDRFFQGRPRLDIDLNALPLIWTGARTKCFMSHIAKRIEEEISRFKPDFVFVETSFAPTRMVWRLAREKGVQAGGFMAVRFWPNRLYLETGIGYDWHQARMAYIDMEANPMTGDELSMVEERLKSIRHEKTKPAYLHSEHAKGAPSFIKRLYPRQLLEGLAPWLGARAGTSSQNPQVLPRKVISPLAKCVRYVNRQKGRRFLKKHQVPFSAIKSKRYAVYFLHVEPEITVEGMAFDYQNQVNTLRNVLASLPADMELVVKEHSPMLGYRPLDVYSQLVHTPGITIADTSEDSHTLITHASVVVTLTGTVALEAVLYGIPAIVLGSIYFDAFNGIYKPESLDELRELLSQPENLKGATEDDALRTLGSLHRASHPGSPHRVDVKLKDIDVDSARAMMTELEKVRP
ncbi:MAG: hypothetical protein AB8G18_04690 [Gammaproteobacteria bacterium]